MACGKRFQSQFTLILRGARIGEMFTFSCPFIMNRIKSSRSFLKSELGWKPCDTHRGKHRWLNPLIHISFTQQAES